MDSDNFFDFIIVGGGMMGLSAARGLRQLIPNGKILLLDQFPLPHCRGSSHGHTRIYRVAYHHPVLSDMAAASVKEWKALEQEFDQTLLHNCGVLVTGRDSHVNKAKESLRRAGAPFTTCSFARLCRDNPLRAQQLQGYPPDQQFLHDPSGGIMFADRCMATLLRFSKENNVVIHDNEKVLELRQPFADARVTIITTKATYSCKSVILTLGPWAPKFLATHLGSQLPIEARLVGSLYWRVNGEIDSLFQAPNFTPLIDYYGDEAINHLYAIPQQEYPGCVKLGHQVGVQVDPDNRELSEYPEEILSVLSNYIGTHLQSLDKRRPVVHEPCMYTQSKDDLYVMDRHPRFPGVVIAAGFSGNGFKMGPIVGKIVAALAVNEDPGFDLRDFSLKRFGRLRAAL